MRDYLDQLRETVASVVSNRLATDSIPDASLDLVLWNALRDLDLIGLGASESVGGSGGDLVDSVTVLEGLLSARVPYAEATVIAAPALSESGIALPSGTFTAASGILQITQGRLSGDLIAVPFARDCQTLVLLAIGTEPFLYLVSLHDSGVQIQARENLAGEARDTVTLSDVLPLEKAPLSIAAATAWELRAALSRVALSAGAAAAIVDQSAKYALERTQFGRPLMKFQVIQHGLAAMAADATAMQVASISATMALNDSPETAGLMVAAAKAESAALVRRVTASAHQIHGAIGFTREHVLGSLTTRLWAWREEHGNERFWYGRIAEIARGNNLWALITGTPELSGTHSSQERQSHE